jgi:thiol:disulfide interchange protein DsbD
MWKRPSSIALPLAIAFVLAAVVALPELAHASADPAANCGDDWASYQAKGWLWMYLGAFGFGFLTSLTPCVYPMIPIVVGVFGARDESVTRIKAFTLATCYVLGMGAMYAGLGVIFALLGKQFGTILANPWVVIPLISFYLLLAASMFGAFELNLPASWQNKLSQVGGKGYGGAFGMGLVGGLTAAPCTGPFLAGILGFVATTRNVAAGSTLLFTFAIGMGILFWVIAAFTVSLPKSGRWMEWIKSIGGVALLAVALYFLRPLLPWLEQLTSTSLIFLLGSIALVAIGAVLGAIHLSFHDAWPVRVRKALGVVFMVAGITGVVNWVLTPDRHLPWQYTEDAAFAQAQAEGKGVMLDFAADWCAPCKELELTFASAGVYESITDHFVPLKFDVSKGTDQDEARQERWKAETLPAVIFVDAQGNELGRVKEYVPSDQFKQIVEPAAQRLRGGQIIPCT